MLVFILLSTKTSSIQMCKCLKPPVILESVGRRHGSRNTSIRLLQSIFAELKVILFKGKWAQQGGLTDTEALAWIYY